LDHLEAFVVQRLDDEFADQWIVLGDATTMAMQGTAMEGGWPHSLGDPITDWKMEARPN
jgi:hypothetical protein